MVRCSLVIFKRNRIKTYNIIVFTYFRLNIHISLMNEEKKMVVHLNEKKNFNMTSNGVF